MTISFGGNLDNKIRVSGVGPQGPEGPAGATGATGPQGAVGATGITGQGFVIAQVYNSLSALLAGSVPEGQFGLVAGTLSTSDPDYGKLYLYSGGSWAYQTDMSVQGIQGPSGNTGATGPAGPTVYPGAGVAVSTGAAWTTSKASPAGVIVGTTDAQTLTNKTLTAPLITTPTLTGYTETVYSWGTTSGTLNLLVSQGTVQTITVNGPITINGFSGTPVSGQTITLVITQDATGSRTLTSNMKFAGGLKTLSTAPNSIDILTISYIGTTYYASLSTGYV